MIDNLAIRECLCLSCDETCSPTYGNVVSTGAGPCGTCAKYGFNKNAATKLYFLEHTEKGLAKIGITNVSTSGAYDRVADFTRLGWWERSRTVFDTGREAEAVEQNIHRKLREMGHQVDEKAAREACGNLGGHTEVFWLAGVEELLEEGYRIE